MADITAYLAPDDAESGVELFRISEDPRFGIIPTTECVEVQTHNLKNLGMPTSVRCLGEACPLCAIKVKLKKVMVLPILNLSTMEVEGLRVSSFKAKRSLLVQLGPHLQSGDLRGRVLTLSREGFDYDVAAVPPLEDMSLPNKAIEDFLAKWEPGDGQLEASVRALSPAELSELPGVIRLRAALGLDRVEGEEPDAEAPAS